MRFVMLGVGLRGRDGGLRGLGGLMGGIFDLLIESMMGYGVRGLYIWYDGMTGLFVGW
jgi:hypothetical protein